MKFTFNQTFAELDGTHVVTKKEKPEESVSVGRQIASFLSLDTKEDCIKFGEWCKALVKGEAIDLDKSDQEFLYQYVKKHQGMPAILKWQFIDAWEESKAEGHPKKAAAKKAA